METANANSQYSPQNRNYAQSGYVTTPNDGGTEYIFAQNSDHCTSGNCGGNCNSTTHLCTRITSTTTSDGDNFEYYTIYSTSSTELEMWYRDGSTDHKIMSTNFDPETEWCSFNTRCLNWFPGPWVQEYLGETHDSNDLIVGSSSQKASFTSVAYAPNAWGGSGSRGFQDDNDILSSNYLTSSQYPPYCNEKGGTQSSFNIWDNATC